MSSNTYIFIYQTVCEANGKTYVGVHKTNDLKDGYIGNGIFKQSDANYRNSYFYKAVRKHGYNSFKLYILDFFDTYEDALLEEKNIVTKYWVKDKQNYNVALGGRGNTISWMSEEERIVWKGKIKDGVNRWLINGGREILIEKQKSVVYKKKFGKENSMFGKKSTQRRPVLQYNINGVFVNRFDCIKDASIFCKISSGNILSCCVGNYFICGGFIFRYEEYSIDELVLLNDRLLKKHIKDNKVKHLKTINIKQPKPSKIVLANNNGCRKLSESHKKSLSKSSARYWLGKKFSIETKDKISKSHIGKKLSLEHKIKISESHKGIPSKKRLAIEQIDCTGVVFKEFISVKDAATYFKVASSTIINIIRGNKNRLNIFLKYKN